MMKKCLPIFFFSIALSGCAALDAINPFSSKKKMPELKPITATVQARVVWQESVGKAESYVFSPAVSGTTIYVAGQAGDIARIDNGKVAWKVNTDRLEASRSLSGGVGTDGRLVAVGSPEGDLLVFSTADGKLLWKAKASSEILAAPVIGDGLVIVRSGDNLLAAYDASDGKRKWGFQRPSPVLTLRVTAPPLIDGKHVFAGYPGGKLVAVNLSNGAAVWEGTVAIPRGTTELERVADITSAPVIEGRNVCAVAFQGRVACFDLGNGNLAWARDMSSAVGLTIDSRHLFVTDDKSAVHALNVTNGTSLWKQDALNSRRVTAPVLYRGFVVVADAQGIVHFLGREDGAFAARVATDGSPVVAPLQSAGSNLIVQTSKGGVFAIEVE